MSRPLKNAVEEALARQSHSGVDFEIEDKKTDLGQNILVVILQDHETPVTSYIQKKDNNRDNNKERDYLELYETIDHISQIVGSIHLTHFYFDDPTILGSISFHIASAIKDALNAPRPGIIPATGSPRP